MRGVTTAYLDWESTEQEVAARVDGICRGLGVDLPPGSILYRPMHRALADEAPRLRADFARHGVRFVIVDSFGPAAGAEPESADSTIRLMNALRSFTDTTKLVLAHVSKAAADQPTGPTRPYGSVFVRNLARSAWELRRAEEMDSGELRIAAYHRKHNGGRRAPAFSLRLRFEADGAVVATGADLAEAPDLLARTTVSKRVTVALAAGALTVAELAEHLCAPEPTVGRILRRLRETGHVVPVGETRPHRWGLAAR
jgi:AAA domain-containing protein